VKVEFKVRQTGVDRMVSKLYSIGLFGMDAYAIEVESDLSRGMPGFDIVGLPGAAVKESRDRVRAAMKNCGFDFPLGRITINLAPANIRKEGPVFDLPILLSILKSSEQLEADMSDCAFVGELSLSGVVRPTRGVLSMAVAAQKKGCKRLFVPEKNAREGAVVKGIDIIPVPDLPELIKYLRGERLITPAKPLPFTSRAAAHLPNFADVQGQAVPKRALEIAAAGGHNALLIGPPGSGKSMLAKRLISILPDMTFEESIETTKIHSIAGVLSRTRPLITSRPFRSPHHTVSPAGLSGGGSIPKPGEISLAHNGVLFLDELPEFSRMAMEILRQPLEDGTVTISRVSGSLSYPCSIMLIAAMNPCPCGFFGHPTKPCTCGPGVVARYLNKISGPLIDRLDLHVEVPPVNFDELSSTEKSESSANIRRRVNAARKRQQERYTRYKFSCNADISPAHIKTFCALTEPAHRILQSAFSKMGLSARAYDRILKMARTIADLDGIDTIDSAHIAQAVQFRGLDRKYWQT